MFYTRFTRGPEGTQERAAADFKILLEHFTSRLGACVSHARRV